MYAYVCVCVCVGAPHHCERAADKPLLGTGEPRATERVIYMRVYICVCLWEYKDVYIHIHIDI